MSTRFAPAGPLRGEAVAPADKSISHRVALVGAMSEDPLTVRNYLAAEDTHATLVAVQALGAGVEEHEDELVIRGVGLHTAHGVTGDRLDVGNSGTLMRLLPGWPARAPGCGPSTATPPFARVRWTGWPSRCVGWARSSTPPTGVTRR